MKKLTIFIMLFLFSSAFLATHALAAGAIKVISPSADCIVMIDGTQMGTGTITVPAAPGMHTVAVTLPDGTPVYNGQTSVDEGQMTTVNIAYDANKSYSQPVYVARPFYYRIREWGEGWGISIGLDNTNYDINGRGLTDTENLGTQVGVDWFFAWKLNGIVFLDLSTGLFRSYGSFKNDDGTITQVSAMPVEFNLKFKVNDNLFLGGGFNYALWSRSTAGLYYAPGIAPDLGYQIMAEIKPISSEIGYIVKSGDGFVNRTGFTATSSGLYYKYKFYF